MNSIFVNTIFNAISPHIFSGYILGAQTVLKNEPYKPVLFSDKGDALKELVKIDYNLRDLDAIEAFQREALQVAGVGEYELMQKLKDYAVNKWQNLDPEEFAQYVSNEMLNYGIKLEDQPPEAWIKTNINTAISSSFSAAQWNKINDPDITDLYPALRYMQKQKKNKRVEHSVFHNKVFMKDDPIWDTIYPPNGWNCGCYTIPVSIDELNKTSVARVTGQMKEVIKSVPPDFQRNPGKENSIYGKWLDLKFKNMPPDVVAKIKKMSGGYQLGK